METLSNLIRLSYWSRIKSVVPASFHELLPPAPEVQPVPGPPEAQAAQDGAEPMVDAAPDERDAATKRASEMLTMVSPFASRITDECKAYASPALASPDTG